MPRGSRGGRLTGCGGLGLDWIGGVGGFVGVGGRLEYGSEREGLTVGGGGEATGCVGLDWIGRAGGFVGVGGRLEHGSEREG